MIELAKKNTGALDLLGSLSRVSTPFIKVVIGDPKNGYTFGVYDKVTTDSNQAREAYRINSVRFPNYIQSLSVQKINGQVNQYTLNLIYTITQDSDPNFFEKVFSSVKQSRKITFTYGDISMPTFIYRDEEAIITNIQTVFKASSSQISYTVHAISSSIMLTAGNSNFPATYAQPSEVIYNLLRQNKCKILDVFYGMRDINKVLSNNLISRDDKAINIPAKTNISILDYITYLVSCMTPTSDTKSSLSKSGLYVLNVMDDVSGIFQGPYFTVKKLTKSSDEGTAGLSTYTVDIGYPSSNIVTNFSVDDDENYSILYDYSSALSQEQYSYRINDNGQMEPVYAPSLSSNNAKHKTTEADRSWWTSVTSYPIQATLTMKGLLRSSILMSYLNLNMYYFGKKHISSGKYCITKQVDTIDQHGFTTTLSLIRVGGTDMDELSLSGSNSLDDSNTNNKTRYKIVNTGVK